MTMRDLTKAAEADTPLAGWVVRVLFAALVAMCMGAGGYAYRMMASDVQRLSDTLYEHATRITAVETALASELRQVRDTLTEVKSELSRLRERK